MCADETCFVFLSAHICVNLRFNRSWLGRQVQTERGFASIQWDENSGTLLLADQTGTLEDKRPTMAKL